MARNVWKNEPPETWGGWHTKLRAKWLNWSHARFPDTDPMTETEMKDFLFKIERKYAEETDAVVMKFAASGRWPAGSWEHAYFLARRVEYAMEILAVLGTIVYERTDTYPWPTYEPVPRPAARPEIIVRWLLIDCWEFGRSHWIDGFILSGGKKR